MKWLAFAFIFSALILVSPTPITTSQVFAETPPCKTYPVGHDLILANHTSRVNSAEFSQDGNSVATASKDGTAIIYNLRTKESHKIPHTNSVNSAEFSPDGNSVVTASNDGTAIVYNLKTKESHKIRHLYPVNSAQFSPDGNSIVTASWDHTAIVYNLKTKTSQRIQHSGSVRSAQFSPDGNSVVTASNDGATIIYNLKTGESHKTQHSDLVNSAQFSPDSNSIVTALSDGTAIVYNLKTKESHKIQHLSGVNSAQFSPDGNSVITASNDRLTKISQFTKTCIDPSLKVNNTKLLKDPQICIKCTNIDKLVDQVENLTDLSVEALCVKDYSKSDWDNVTPKIDLGQTSISEKDALMYLLRFQKMGGFEAKAHLPILLAILKSDLVVQKPELISNALANVLSVSNQLFESLLEEFPNLRKPLDTKATSKDFVCQNDKDKNAFTQAAIEYLKYKKYSNPKRSSFSDWQDLGAISNFLAKLPPAQKESALYDIAFSLADGAADDSRYSGIFYSKIFQFTKRAAMPLFGLKEETKPLTDLSLVRERNKIKPILLGEAPINNEADTKTVYGFFIKNFPEIKIPADVQPGDKLYDSTVKWEMKGKPYTAKLKIDVGDKNKALIPEGDSPKYSELRRGEDLVGLVMTGTSLGGSQTASTMNEYLSYYEKEGFEFSNDKKEISNITEFLKTQVESGELKYMIKEAHSDGDDKNLFRMSTKANLLIGINKKTNEKIYLAFPSPTDNTSTLLSNQEFGQWIREREKKGGGQIVYFNTSCGSKAKAVHEI